MLNLFVFSRNEIDCINMQLAYHKRNMLNFAAAEQNVAERSYKNLLDYKNSLLRDSSVLKKQLPQERTIQILDKRSRYTNTVEKFSEPRSPKIIMTTDRSVNTYLDARESANSPMFIDRSNKNIETYCQKNKTKTIETNTFSQSNDASSSPIKMLSTMLDKSTVPQSPKFPIYEDKAFGTTYIQTRSRSNSPMLIERADQSIMVNPSKVLTRSIEIQAPKFIDSSNKSTNTFVETKSTASGTIGAPKNVAERSTYTRIEKFEKSTETYIQKLISKSIQTSSNAMTIESQNSPISINRSEKCIGAQTPLASRNADKENQISPTFRLSPKRNALGNMSTNTSPMVQRHIEKYTHHSPVATLNNGNDARTPKAYNTIPCSPIKIPENEQSSPHHYIPNLQLSLIKSPNSPQQNTARSNDSNFSISRGKHSGSYVRRLEEQNLTYSTQLRALESEILLLRTKLAAKDSPISMRFGDSPLSTQSGSD